MSSAPLSYSAPLSNSAPGVGPEKKTSAPGVVQWNLGLSNVKISKNLDLSNVFAATIFLLSKSASK